LCNGYRLGVAYYRYVGTLQLDIRFAQRDRVLSLRHVTLGVVHHLAFEEHDGIVIPDR